MSSEPIDRRGVRFGISPASSPAMARFHKPSCRLTGGREGCEMSRSSTTPAIMPSRPSSMVERGSSGSSSGGAGKCEQVVVGVCAMNSKVRDLVCVCVCVCLLRPVFFRPVFVHSVHLCFYYNA